MTSTPTSAPTIDWSTGQERHPEPVTPVPTLIAVVLDRSGSMAAVKDATDSGFNEFVNKQRRIGGVCKVTLAQFDDVYEVVYSMRDLAAVPKLDLQPRGMTALLDAVGRTVTQLDADLNAMPLDNRPAKVIVAILTDGYENASREWTRPRVRDAILAHPEWDFIYIGADQDAITVGMDMGFAQGATMSSTATAAGTHGTYASLSGAVSATRRGGDTMSYLTDNANVVAAAAMGDADATAMLEQDEAEGTSK